MYELAYMATPRDKYYTKMAVTMHHFPMRSFDKSISKVMAETEAEERSIISDAHNVNMDTFCQSPFTTNTQG